MGKKQYAKEPLLYIEQPTIQNPQVLMQSSYSTPKKADRSARVVKKKVNNRPHRRAQYFIDQLYDDEPSYQQENQQEIIEEEEESSQSPRHKKFSELSLREKVYYFINIPNYAPKIKCEIRTDEDKYRGFITDFKDNEVFIRVGRRSSSTKILFDDIQDIRMLGF